MANTLKFGNGQFATKKGSTLAYNDENGNFKPLPFTFDRSTSATRVNKEGLIEVVSNNEPRIDFLNDSKGALLLEPSRSNAITNSEEFGSTGWSFVTTGSAIAPIVSNDYAISPDGTQNAQRIQFDLGGGTTSSDRTIIRQNVGAQSDWFFSVWIKSTNGQEQKILWQVGGDENETTVTGEWQRYTFSKNGTPTSYLGLSLRGSTSTVDTADILVYGFQAEQGSYATSYIPTQGSSVTRVAESCVQTPPSGIIGQTEGVIYWEGIINGTENNFANIVTGERNQTTSFSVLHRKSPSEFQCSVFDGSTKGVCRGGSVVFGEKYKIAYAYKSGDFALYVNGVLVDTSTDTWSPPSTIDNIFVGDATTYFGFKESNTNKQIKFYNTRLSNTELQALTTI